MPKCGVKMSDIKELLDNLTNKYETEDFINDDPIQFPHRYKKREDIEIAGFLASLFAYGKREVFIGKLNTLFSYMGKSPYDYIIKGVFDLNGLNYRFFKTTDIEAFLCVLHTLYTDDGGLYKLFEKGYKSGNLMQYICDYFYSRAPKTAGGGFYFGIPNPVNGGAMKRMWMFLRWMVRKPPVDMGIWEFIPISELKIPVDTHVARISRELGLLKRNSNDCKAVDELSNVLAELSPEDPVKYDFALFGYGVNNK